MAVTHSARPQDTVSRRRFWPTGRPGGRNRRTPPRTAPEPIEQILAEARAVVAELSQDRRRENGSSSSEGTM